MSKRAIMSVNLDNIGKLPHTCRDCGYWESNEKKLLGVNSAENLAKEHWFNLTITEWGQCGKMVVQDKRVVGFSQYAPPSFFPQLRFAEVGPIHNDAIFIACLFVPQTRRGRGLGKLLLNAVEKDLIKRRYKVIETIAKHTYERNPAGWIEFYLNRGFRIIKEKGPAALMRLDLNTAVTRQEYLEALINSLPQLIPVKGQAKLPTPS